MPYNYHEKVRFACNRFLTSTFVITGRAICTWIAGSDRKRRGMTDKHIIGISLKHDQKWCCFVIVDLVIRSPLPV